MKTGRMAKRFAAIAAACLLASCFALAAFAQGSLDLSGKASLSVHFGEGDKGFSDVEFSIYQVAGATASGTYSLIGDFQQYPVSLEDLDSSGLRALAQTLDTYVMRDKIEPTQIGATSSSGTVSFTGLPVGLYLVLGEQYVEGETVYTPGSLLVYLPKWESGSWNYNVSVTCKYDKGEWPGEPTEIKVQKVWKDSGNEKRRPELILAQLLKNGEIVDTVSLSKENNWEYTWKDLDSGAQWRVAEAQVPTGYTAAVEREGDVFILTNTYPPKTPTKLPQTGMLWWPVVLLAVGGAVLLSAGLVLGRNRRNDHEK